MITKDKAIEVIKSLPEEFSIEELMDRLILLNKIETGIKQATSGEKNGAWMVKITWSKQAIEDIHRIQTYFF